VRDDSARRSNRLGGLATPSAVSTLVATASDAKPTSTQSPILGCGSPGL
jgi:hypothetical protein